MVTRRRSMVRDSAYSWRPIAAPSSEASVESPSSATSATVVMPQLRNLSAVTAPIAPQPAHGQWVQERQLLVRRNQQ